MPKLAAKRRFTDHKKVGKPMVLRDDHPAVLNARTLFPNRVQAAQFEIALFKSGVNSRKIGSHVTKGAWKGMPIYTLTLEERATCPSYCEHWKDCFGNKMQWPTRWRYDARFMGVMVEHLKLLARQFPDGFVVRLHVLGDFPNPNYVNFWHMVMIVPQIHVFGYTRWNKESPVGKALQKCAKEFPDRWKIRWSERGGVMGTKTSTDVTLRGNTKDGIVCPAQTNDSDCCGTCALCWSTDKPIVFLNH